MNELSPVLVGRKKELAFLGQAFDDAQSSSMTAALLGGEAGAGKSRLIREFLSGITGARTLLGGCLELGAQGFPFAPFSAMLRGLVRETGLDGVKAMLAPGASRELSRLLPEFGEPGTEPGDTLGSDAETRARLFEHVLGLLERLAEDSPVILVIEDAHWADRSTRDLLAFLIRNLNAPGLLLVVTYRSDDLHRSHPLRPLLAELGRVEGVRRLELERLSRRNVAELIDRIHGSAPGDALLDNVYRRSEGNPLFVESLAGHVGGPLPESLRDLLLSGVQDLPDETQEVLRDASASGTRIDHQLLAAVTGLSDAALTRALRPAVAANVLVVDGEAYAYRHALIREAIHYDLLPGEHTRLHTRYAEALASDPSLVPAGRAAATLAMQTYAAHDIPGALVSAWRAADAAKKAAAYTEKMDMLSRVLELWDKVPDAAARIGAEHIQVLREAVWAAHLAGEAKRGLAFAEQALREADPESDPEHASYFLELRGRLKLAIGLPGVLDDLRESVALAPADPPGGRRANALAALAAELVVEEKIAEARTVAEEALAVSRRIGSAATEIDALTTLAGVESDAGDIEPALAGYAEARVLAERGQHAGDLMRVATNESSVLESAGEYERAIEVAQRAMAASDDFGLARTKGAFLAGNVAWPLIALGRWDEASEVLEHSLALAPPAFVRGFLEREKGHIALARGDLAAAAAALAKAQEAHGRGAGRPQEIASGAELELELRLAEGNPDRALDVASRLPSEPDLTVSARYCWPLLALAADACALALSDPGLRERAAALLADLRSLAERTEVRGPVQRAYSLTFSAAANRASALAGGPADSGSGAWDEAAAAWEALRQPYPLAGALLRSAEAAAAEGERSDAASRLRRATELAGDLRAAPLQARIETLARRAGVQLGGHAPAAPEHRLTPRELEVLRLVAEGRSNRDIAGQLFISAKTASVHVSNILAKLGVSGRGEAAAAAHRMNLVRPS